MKPKLPQSYKKLWADKKRTLKMYGITVLSGNNKRFCVRVGTVWNFVYCLCKNMPRYYVKWLMLVLGCNFSLKLQNFTLDFYNSSLGL